MTPRWGATRVDGRVDGRVVVGPVGIGGGDTTVVGGSTNSRVHQAGTGGTFIPTQDYSDSSSTDAGRSHRGHATISRHPLESS